MMSIIMSPFLQHHPEMMSGLFAVAQLLKLCLNKLQICSASASFLNNLRVSAFICVPFEDTDER